VRPGRSHRNVGRIDEGGVGHTAVEGEHMTSIHSVADAPYDSFTVSMAVGRPYV
jgi:hypothetical protein